MMGRRVGGSMFGFGVKPLMQKRICEMTYYVSVRTNVLMGLQHIAWPSIQGAIT